MRLVTLPRVDGTSVRVFVTASPFATLKFTLLVGITMNMLLQLVFQPIHRAAREGSARAIQAELDKGVDINVRGATGLNDGLAGSTALIFAACDGMVRRQFVLLFLASLPVSKRRWRNAF